MTSPVLAVDGGNSKTLAIICDERGTVLGFGRGGGTDLYGVRAEQDAHDAMTATVTEAFDAAGIDPADLSHAAFRLAGVDWPEDRDHWRHLIAARWPGLGSFSVENDALAGLRAGRLDGSGVAIVLGTGPAIAARNAIDGSTAALGWWLREPMGAVGLGTAALELVYRAALGTAPESALTRAVLEATAEVDAAALLRSFTRRGSLRSWRDVARLAPTVTRLASAEEPDAVRIVDEQAAMVAGYAAVAARQVGLDRSAHPVVLAGSLLASQGSPLSTALVRELAVTLPLAEAVHSDVAPIHGGALDALAEAGVRLTPDIRDRLLATGPDPALLVG